MNFYKRHIGDISKACAHLSQGQQGAYDLLLDWLYGNEKPLPLEHGKLHRIGRAATKVERENVDVVVSEFFTKTADGYVQKRAAEEVAKYQENAEKNRVIAVEREAKKRAEKEARNEHEPCYESSTDRGTNGQPSQNPESRDTSKAESPNGDLSPASAAPPAEPDSENRFAGSAAPMPDDPPDPPSVPPCPVKRIIAEYHRILPALPAVRAFPDTAERMLRARWREDPERQSLAWWSDWFEYVATCPLLMGQKNAWSADLMWLVRPTNFAKVINGNYQEDLAHG